ncbi:MAG: sugar transferase [Verrucomicrobiota bacterium]
MRLRRLFSWQKSSVVWFLIDFVIGVSAVFIAYRGQSLPIDLRTLEPMPLHPGAIPAGLVFGSVLGFSYYAFGGEAREWRKYSWQRNILISLSCVAVASIALVLVFFLFFLQIGRVIVLTVAIVAFVVSYLVRLVVFSRIELEKRRLLLITDEDHQPSGQMSALLSSYYDLAQIDRKDLKSTSPSEWIEEWVDLGVQDVVFVSRCDPEITEPLLAECWRMGLSFVEWNYFVESTFRKLNVYDQHLDWLMHFGQQYAHPAYSKLKRAMDIMLSLIGLIAFSPLLLVGIALVSLGRDGPIFFKQPRVGARGSVFTLWKLRTMKVVDRSGDSPVAQAETAVEASNEKRKETGHLFPSADKSRITAVGRFLRITRIDELPQLMHVLVGDMSLVGPRPEWTEVARKWEKEFSFYPYRTLVKPGLTGWAQVNFSYAETREEVLEKLSYDFYYIKHASMGLDLRIILRTVSAMIEGGR